MLPLVELDDALGAARRTTSWLRRHRRRRCRIDQSHALALRRLEGRGRRDGAGVRPLLRDADGLLPRRLPHRPAARRRPAARLPRLPDALHGAPATPYTIFGYKGKQVRDNIHAYDVVRAFDAFPPSAAAGGGLQPRRRARLATCSMLEAIELCEEIAGRELDVTLSDEARIGDHQLVVSDLGSFQRRLPGLEADLRHRATCCEDIYDAQRRALDCSRDRMKLSRRHPGAQRGGLDRRDGRARSTAALRAARRSTTRSSSSTTASTDGTAADRQAARRSATRASAASARPTAAASASPCAPGSSVHRRRRRDHDGRRLGLPRTTSSRYYRLLEAGYDCAFGSRFMTGAHASRATRASSSWSTALVNLGIRLLFGHGYNDTTNAFKAYRREVIENVQPLLSPPLQPHRRAAAEGDRPRPLLRDRPDLVDATARPACPSCDLQEMGSRYLFIVLYGLPRAPPQPRRLPPPRPRRADDPRPVARRPSGSPRDRASPAAGARAPAHVAARGVRHPEPVIAAARCARLAQASSSKAIAL